MRKKLGIILAVGILIRLIFSSISYHSDIQALNFTGRVVTSGHVLDMYDFLPSLEKDNPILKPYPSNLFNYPPAVYLVLGSLMSVSTAFTNPIFQDKFFFNLRDVLGTWQLMFYLVLLKLPYYIFDLVIAFALLRLFQSEKEKIMAFAFWIFNPVNLYASYLIGQFDIIPTSFVVLSLLFASRPKLAALMLGIGAAFKIYPLFLLVPLMSSAGNFKNKVQVLILGVLPYILTLLPYLMSKGFRSTALVANQTLKSLYAQIPISGGESIIIFLSLLIFIYIVILQVKLRPQNLWQGYFISLLPFFIFTHYHLQWFVWLTPFLLFALIKSGYKNLLSLSVALFSFVGLIFFFEPGLSIGLFSPLNPGLYDGASIWRILNLYPDYNLARSILQSLFVGSAIFYIYNYFPKRVTGD